MLKRKALAMLSNKHILLTEEREHVDEETRGIGQIKHTSIYNSQIYVQKLTHTSRGC